jgi:hypothetical protein
MPKKVKLEVLKNGAIYVDDFRITNRSTKPWGGSPTIFYTCTSRKKVVQTLIDNGHSIKRIDEKPYSEQVKEHHGS